VDGVSERPARENEEERSSHVPTSQRWKAPWSTGCRSPSRVAGEVWVLVGPVEGMGLVPMHSVAPATTGVLWKNEEGNVVSVRQAHALVAAGA
jgi:hypothetical protein